MYAASRCWSVERQGWYSFVFVSDGDYVFGEDVQEERERLAAVERAVDGSSRNALLEVGVDVGWRCWEVGAGRGSIARWLSVVVGTAGQVLATDLTDEWFDPAATDVRFQRHDVVRDPVPEGAFDLVHARFLLEHLADPRSVIARLIDALRPGGVIVLEDSAGLELDITPSPGLTDEFLRAWERAGRAVGWNPFYGAELMVDLRALELRELGGRQCRELAPGGPSWTHVAHGLRRVERQLIEQGISQVDLKLVLRSLADPASLIVGPAVTIAWARRAGVAS
ncbi:MAG: class I SAM-dependent methyltransferase [Solirubrobacterales bacterium]|nr:class I SAM-dependent methyltransferase [Solirubrobacterales bacterium]